MNVTEHDQINIELDQLIRDKLDACDPDGANVRASISVARAEGLGLLVSEYCKSDTDEILRVAVHALSNSGARNVAKHVTDLLGIDMREGERHDLGADLGLDEQGREIVRKFIADLAEGTPEEALIKGVDRLFATEGGG